MAEARDETRSNRPATARDFSFFAEMCAREGAPLYAALSARIAQAPHLLELASDRLPGQPPANLLLGAVHALLLAGHAHPLAEFYPSVGGRGAPEQAYPAFLDFVRAHEASIRDMIRTHRVQTNEVGRCGLLLPALALGWQRLERRPLHVIELGTSAGLLLGFDRYAYDYGDGRRCGDASPAVVRTALRGPGVCPVPDVMPTVASRTGVDARPVDVADDAAVRWVEGLIWPDMPDRLELFRAAVAIARTEPIPVRAGDGTVLMPSLVADVSGDAVPCLFHSHALYQMKPPRREAFRASVAALGRERDLMYVSLEWLEDDPRPQLHLTVFRGGRTSTWHLADCHHHGRWMRWLGD